MHNINTLLLDPNNKPKFTPTLFTLWNWRLLATLTEDGSEATDRISCVNMKQPTCKIFT